MNKLLITLCLAASFMLSGCYNSGEPREKVLKIYNWADYIGDGVLEDFRHIIRSRQARIFVLSIKLSISTKSC